MTEEERALYEADCARQIEILNKVMATTDSPVKRCFYEGQIKTLQQMLDRLAQEAKTIDVEFSDCSKCAHIEN